MANIGTSSGGAAKAAKVLERHEGHWGPSQMKQTNLDSFHAKYCFPAGTHFGLPSRGETPYTRGAMGEMYFFKAPLKFRVRFPLP